MRFKRKIAASMATVMALGSFASLNVFAQGMHNPVTNTQQQITVNGVGFRGGLMIDRTLGIGTASPNAGNVNATLDLVIPGHALNPDGTITVTLPGGSSWQFGETPNDNRPFRRAVAGPVNSSNFGFISGGAVLSHTFAGEGSFVNQQDVTSAPLPGGVTAPNFSTVQSFPLLDWLNAGGNAATNLQQNLHLTTVTGALSDLFGTGTQFADANAVAGWLNPSDTPNQAVLNAINGNAGVATGAILAQHAPAPTPGMGTWTRTGGSTGQIAITIPGTAAALNVATGAEAQAIATFLYDIEDYRITGSGTATAVSGNLPTGLTEAQAVAWVNDAASGWTYDDDDNEWVRTAGGSTGQIAITIPGTAAALNVANGAEAQAIATFLGNIAAAHITGSGTATAVSGNLPTGLTEAQAIAWVNAAGSGWAYTAGSAAPAGVSMATWNAFAAWLNTFNQANASWAVTLGALNATVIANAVGDNVYTVHVGNAAGALVAAEVYAAFVNAPQFVAWFNHNRAAFLTLRQGSGATSVIVPNNTAQFPGANRVLGNTGGLGGQIVYTGIPTATAGQWHELPYQLNFGGTMPSNQVQIVVPTGLNTGHGAYLRLPIVANIPESVAQFGSQLTLTGTGVNTAFIPGTGLALNLGGVTPAGGVFRLELGTTNLNNLTEQHVVRQPRISVYEQGAGNFMGTQNNSHTDPLRGFYFSLPGNYVWQNAYAIGTIQADHVFHSNNENNLGMQGVGLQLLGFTHTDASAARGLDGSRPFAFNNSHEARPLGTNQAFGGVWDNHLNVLRAIVQSEIQRAGNNVGPALNLHADLQWLNSSSPNIVNGIVMNLDQQFAATHPVRNTNYAFLSHNGSRINVVLGDTSGALGSGNREIRLTNLAIGHANVNAPITGYADLSVGNNILGNHTIGNIGAHTNIPAAQVISASPANPLVVRTGNFSTYGLTFERASGAVGEVTDIISGRTYTEGAWNRQPNAATNTVAMTISDFASRTARVDLTELTASSGFNARNFSFAPTDSEGNVLEGVNIAAVTFHTTGTGGNGRGINNTTFYNVQGSANPARQWNIVGQGAGANANFTGQANNAVSPDPTVEFSPTGHHVLVNNLRTEVLAWDNANRPMQNQRLQIQATFFLSVNPNFEGPIYISVDNDRNFDMQFRTDFVTNDGRVHVANAERLVDVTTQPTTVNIGFNTVEVQNIQIVERAAGALRQGSYLEIALGEHAHSVNPWSGLGFNAVTAANVEVTGHDNPNMRTTVNVATQAGGVIRLNVTRASVGQPSTITLSNLSVQAHQAVPVGEYNLYVRGTAIMDNDYFTVNARAAQTVLGNPLLGSTETGHRRYAFTQGLVVENFVNVTTPTVGAGIPGYASLQNQLRFQQGSHVVYVNGQARNMTTAAGMASPVRNIEGRNFMPLRGFAQLFGPDSIAYGFITPGQPGVWVSLTVGGTSVRFEQDSNAFTVNGTSHTMDTTMVNIDGTTLIPIGFIGVAFDLPVTYEGAGANQIVYFNNPDFGTPMTVGNGATAPAAQTAEVENNGNGNGNGNNGNGNGNGNGDDEEDAA